jgi:cobalamin biosynthesis protein CobT
MRGISITEAEEIIDTFGPEMGQWPASVQSDLLDLMADNQDFADYVKQARELDDMLSSWKEDEDGAAVEDDDADQGEDDDADEDFGSGDGDEEEEEGSHSDYEPDPAFKEIDFSDFEDVEDMDAMLSNIIQVAINQERVDFEVFTRDYDRIVIPEVADDTSVEDISKTVAQTVGPLMKDLRRLIAARSQAKRTPGMRKGRKY